jgi:hypothetical protein
MVDSGLESYRGVGLNLLIATVQVPSSLYNQSRSNCLSYIRPLALRNASHLNMTQNSDWVLSVDITLRYQSGTYVYYT